MNRRQFVTSTVPVAVGLTGCLSHDGGSTTPDVDTGTIYDGKLGELRNWMVEVVDSQSVTVKSSDINEGERLLFQVGDGTSFVHSYRFYEEDSGTTNTFEFDGDGQHQLQLSPGRHEPPMNKNVEISLSMKISAP